MWKNLISLVLCFTLIECDHSNCGLSGSPVGLVINGNDTFRGEYPWIAAIFHAELNKYLCGGTILTNKFIITGAHCVHFKGRSRPLDAEQVIAYLGKHNLKSNFERGSQISYVSKIIVHEDWKPLKETYDADLALLESEDMITFNSFIFPICLWTSQNDILTQEGIVVAWGQTQNVNLDPSETPKMLSMTSTTNENCFLQDHRIVFLSSKRTFCAKASNSIDFENLNFEEYARSNNQNTEGSALCRGDSGSGFVFKVGKNWFLRGIVSSSFVKMNKCDLSAYAVFTNVLKFNEWIIPKIDYKQEITNSIDIVSRSMWGAKSAGPKILYLKPPSQRIMISHTVTSECNDLSECSGILRDMQNYAMLPENDFNDIYCNFFIGANGLIFEGRGWDVRGEHTVKTEGNNLISHNDALCVAFIGNYESKVPQHSQIDSFQKLINYGVTINKVTANYVINAQRDFHPSKSPGDVFYNLIKTWPKYRNTV